MIEIIKEGKNLEEPKYNAVCSKCDCEFTYTDEDMRWKYVGVGYDTAVSTVTCPWCKTSFCVRYENIF